MVGEVREGATNMVALSRRYETFFDGPPLIRLGGCDGKHPLDRKWQIGPREEPDEWRHKLTGWDGNVGMLTGHGLFVVDVDLYKPGAQEAFDALRELGLPDDTVRVLTGRGGLHLYYRSPIPIATRWEMKDANGEDYVGIDIRGEGGFVVVPPSVSPESKRAYEWESGYPNPDDS